MKKTKESSKKIESGIKEERAHGLDLISKYRGAVMGFAALWILFFHEWIPITGESFAVASVPLEAFFKRIGFCGVDIFLFLSGIGLTYSIGKSGVFSFYYRRIKRIILPFLTMAILRCILEKWPFVEFLKNISGINFYTKSIYSFLWFVPAILTLYLAFPWYYKLFSKSKKPQLFLLCSLEIWLILSLFVRETMRNDLYGFTNRIPIFLIGIFIGWLAQNKKIVFTKISWILIALTFVLGLYLSYLSNYKDMYILVPISNCCIPNMLMASSLPLLLAKFLDFLSHAPYVKIIGKGFTKVLAFFGMFSLEFYCVQEWLGGRIINQMNGKYHNMVINLAVLAAVTVIAFLAHLLFQQFWKLVDFLIAKLKRQKRTV